MGLLDELNNSDFDSDEKKVSYDKPKKAKTSVSFIGVIVLLALTVFGSFYVIKKKPEILGLAQNAELENQKEINKYVEEVGKLMLLPDETPTLATVTDLDKVKNQDFFKNAQEGDKVLVFLSAKKAVLYRPSESKIIEVGVVSANAQNSSENADDQINVELLPSLTPSPSPAASSPTSAPVTTIPTKASQTVTPTP